MNAPAVGAVVLRIVLGVIYIIHGYRAWAIRGPKAVGGIIIQLGYPASLADALAWYLIVAHIGGGLLLVVGLRVPWAALAQVPIMASAVFLLHIPQGFFMLATPAKDNAGSTTVGGYEYALLVLAATLAVALLGAGPWSIDHALQRARRRPYLP